ncbi:MAG: ornithine carbamoyltransferase [Thermoleophilia bacterium]|jgi:ornithine carbamoyltransferase|nr:ornithine carbamoyltransferase [Thermoleophilia bacterium]
MVRPEPHPGLRGRSVLTLMHHPSDTIGAVLDLADALKREPVWPAWLAGRTVAMIFEKPSTRTRVSFEAAIARLGGHPIALSGRDMQLGRGETIEDTAKVLSRFVDAIVIRTGAHASIEELSRHADVPVVNALTHAHHPCQALADAQTLRERFGSLEGLPVAYVGDGNNCCASLMIVGAHTGMHVTCGCPEGYLPDPDITAWCAATAEANGGSVRVVQDPVEAVAGARGVYTDVWVSMGDEEQEAERIGVFSPYRVDDALMGKAAPDAVALHPLPAHDGLEITRSVLHGPRSAAWDEAENRMHAQAALLTHLLG